MAVRQGREPWEGRARVRQGGPGARQWRVPVPHSTAPFSLGGHPRGMAGMGPGLTGRIVGVCHPRAVGAGVWVLGPNTVPLACMRCRGCVLWEWWGAVPRGGGLPPL